MKLYLVWKINVNFEKQQSEQKFYKFVTEIGF